MQMTVRKKLIAGFSAVLAVLVAIIAIAYYEMRSVDRQYTQLVNNEVQTLVAVKQLEVIVRKEQGSMRGYLIIGDDTSLTNFNKAHDDYQKLSSQLSPKLEGGQSKVLLDKLNALEQQFYQFGQDVFQLKRQNKVNEYTQLVATKGREITKEFEVAADQLVKMKQKEVNEANQATSKRADAAIIWMMIFGGIALIVGMMVAYYISKIISRPVIAVSEAAKQIASGDLTGKELMVKNRDEIGEMARAFNQMARQLREVIEQVSMNAEQVAASSEQLTASAEQTSKATEQITVTMQDVAAGMEKQVESVGETRHIVEEMSLGVKRIAERSQNATILANGASEKALKGNQSIQLAVTQMNSIDRTVTGLAKVVKNLGERSKQIGQIIEVITGIAEQTNLLALNAAIEAARAGENGRGFAVVADEVRKLAEQSGQSAQQISTLITTIQQETTEAVHSMETAITEVANGIGAIHTAGESFVEIKTAVQEVAGQMKEISSSVKNMLAGAEKIVKAMQLINQNAESAAAGTEEVSAATEEQLAAMEEISASAIALSNMAEELQALIGKFKLS
ncbi:methyl-accepting chemotaxis protein [Anoxybacteroides amylolyticum]|uniref:Methyl-accepting chemotaxis (MCP) signaling domain protein n=1 Tax=Anoxybacteroides amylolyticum TaxID=294699 RepID=A0A160F176_9BACL|nr:methyl-accepting chemotaxis protein [Anoxybacillus amylolyticus]ANB59332.1 methyl-accepting chemotaxis (MCP) signaling domain protein [Anoxybacillus amylolyticus]